MDNKQALVSTATVNTGKIEPCNDNSKMRKQGLSVSFQCLHKELKEPRCSRKQKKRPARSLAELTRSVVPMVGPAPRSADGTAPMLGAPQAPLPTCAYIGSSNNSNEGLNKQGIITSVRQKFPVRRNLNLMKPVVMKKTAAGPEVVEVSDDAEKEVGVVDVDVRSTKMDFDLNFFPPDWDESWLS